ncbi:F0F1 ATP synthase subunit A [bacterium]|nr:F0F1 ATP synthase subunit A [bacterium]
MAADDPFHHVRDFGYFELPGFAAQWLGLPDHKLWLPKLNILGFEFQLTKFMVLQVVAGLLTLIIFSDLARRIKGGKPAAGAWANFWESIAVFLRDNVVRPTLGGHHDDHAAEDHGAAAHGAEHHGHMETVHEQRLGQESHDHDPHPEDKHLPFVWSCFFYILFCNLLGAVPMLGSATGNINVTGSLALCALGATYLVGARELGAAGFFKNLVPPLDAPGWMKIALVPMMFVIEIIGLLIKHGVLAVRLFANIMGGHTVIGVMLGFIASVLHSPYPDLWYIVMPASILGQIGIGMLELFVAFLQAYVFAFLSTIFISMGSHPH